MDNELSDCQEHTFSVFASNLAGSGVPRVTTAVIPICKFEGHYCV